MAKQSTKRISKLYDSTVKARSLLLMFQDKDKEDKEITIRLIIAFYSLIITRKQSHEKNEGG